MHGDGESSWKGGESSWKGGESRQVLQWEVSRASSVETYPPALPSLSQEEYRRYFPAR